jgi:signal transduction histidine kinase
MLNGQHTRAGLPAFAHALVAGERARISRELHDNVTTELTALVWRVREMSGAAPACAEKEDLQSVAERLRGVIEELRNVVLALRGPERDFAELERDLVSRVRELCGEKVLGIEVTGQLSDAELWAFRAGVLPICFELVHNAITHSGGTGVRLRLHIGSILELRVEDDGTGLSEAAWRGSQGGLCNVRARVERLRGHVELQPSTAGMCISVAVPRPLQLEG